MQQRDPAVEEHSSFAEAAIIAGRPNWSADGWTIPAANGFAREIAETLSARPGTPLIVEGSEHEPHGMGLVASLLKSQLRLEGFHVRLFSARLIRPSTESGLVQLILDAPALPQIEGLLTRPTGNPLVLFGTASTWQQIPVAGTVRRLSASRPLSQEERREAERTVFQRIEGAIGASEPARHLFDAVARLDSIGVPFPSNLAALLIGEKESVEILAALADVLIELPEESTDYSGSLLCTPGPELARRYLEMRYGSPGWEPLGPILDMLDPQSQDHRRVAAALAIGLVRGAKRRWLRHLAEHSEQGLARFWETSVSPGAGEILSWGQALRDAGCFVLASSAYARGIALYPRSSYLLQGAAVLELRRAIAQPNERIQAFERLESLLHTLEEVPGGEPFALQARGEKARIRGERERAWHLFQELRKRFPESAPVALTSLAALALDAPPTRSATRDAEKTLNDLAEIATGSPYLPHLRGRLALRRNDDVEAERLFRTTLDCDPSNLPTLVEWAKRARDRGQLQKARMLIVRALAVDPESLEARHSQAEIESDGADFELACTLLRELRDEQPENVPVLVSLGRALARRGRAEERDEAIGALASAARLEPDNPLVYAARMDTLLDFGEVDSARALSEPGSERARSALGQIAMGRLFAALGDPARARQRYAAAAQIGTAYDRIRVYNTHAEFEQRIGTPEGQAEAERLLRQALEMDPDNAYTRAHLSGLLEATGRGEEAAMHRAAADALRLCPWEEAARMQEEYPE